MWYTQAKGIPSRSFTKARAASPLRAKRLVAKEARFCYFTLLLNQYQSFSYDASTSAHADRVESRHSPRFAKVDW